MTALAHSVGARPSAPQTTDSLQRLADCEGGLVAGGNAVTNSAGDSRACLASRAELLPATLKLVRSWAFGSTCRDDPQLLVVEAL